jgi:hypothetical protein
MATTILALVVTGTMNLLLPTKQSFVVPVPTDRGSFLGVFSPEILIGGGRLFVFPSWLPNIICFTEASSQKCHLLCIVGFGSTSY